MAGTTTVIRNYPLADFPNQKCNTAILAQEIKDDPAVLVEPSVQQSGTTVALQFAALITAAEVVALDALVAAHQGEDFAAPVQAVAAEAAVSTGATKLTLITLTSGPLTAGTYLVGWYAESKLAAAAADTGARLSLDYSINGGAVGEAAGNTSNIIDWESFAGSYPLTLKDGESVNALLAVQRVGVGAVNADARRARITLARIG
jgi:hypothetical protein